MTLAEFLLARIAEDEAGARAATQGHWSWEGDYPYGTCPHSTEWTDHGPDLVTDVPWTSGGNTYPTSRVANAFGYDASGFEIRDADADHITRWDPARVLAECEARRQIVAAFPRRWTTDLSVVAGIGTGSEFDWWEDYEGVRHDMREGNPPGSVEVVPEVLRILALPYKEHPDYQEEWT